MALAGARRGTNRDPEPHWPTTSANVATYAPQKRALPPDVERDLLSAMAAAAARPAPAGADVSLTTSQRRVLYVRLRRVMGLEAAGVYFSNHYAPHVQHLLRRQHLTV